MKVKDIELNRYYLCRIQGSNQHELCKIVRCLPDINTNGTRVYWYKTVCYYTGKDLYIGTLAQCRQWMMDHMIGVDKQ